MCAYFLFVSACVGAGGLQGVCSQFCGGLFEDLRCSMARLADSRIGYVASSQEVNILKGRVAISSNRCKACCDQ